MDSDSGKHWAHSLQRKLQIKDTPLGEELQTDLSRLNI